jgi:predicted double-glycine peptidase
VKRLLATTLLLLGSAGAQSASLRLPLAGHDASVSVRSLLEIRDHRLVRQGWDISCGAAALSTILTHTFDTPYSELTIAVSILANTDPAEVRARGGFSLLDLKRFAEAVGFEARGYGGLTLADLGDSRAPAIVPVTIRGLDHFVVFRHRIGDRVLIGDPAFGNLVVSERRFARMWQSGLGMFVAPPGGADQGRGTLPDNLMELAIPDLRYAYRVFRGAGAIPTGPR